MKFTKMLDLIINVLNKDAAGKSVYGTFFFKVF